MCVEFFHLLNSWKKSVNCLPSPFHLRGWKKEAWFCLFIVKCTKFRWVLWENCRFYTIYSTFFLSTASFNLGSVLELASWLQVVSSRIPLKEMEIYTGMWNFLVLNCNTNWLVISFSWPKLLLWSPVFVLSTI